MNKNLNLIEIITLIAVTLSACVDPAGAVEGKCQSIALANGRPKLQRQGRLVRFRCFKGYEFVGRRYMTCFQGKWDFQRESSVNYPMCVRPGCRASSYVNGHFFETYKGAVVSVVCNLGYTLVGPQTVYCNGYKWNQQFPECKAIDKTPARSCDFETDLCGWVQDPHGDWLWQKAASDNPAGPPYEDGNLGHYILLGNSSSRITNATERLFSPVFPPEYSTDSCFSFWYLLHGRTAGYLKVFVKLEGSELYNTIPPFWVTGDQSPNWLPGYFPIYPSQVPFQIVFEGMSLAGNESRTAFDDVKLLSGGDCERARAFYASHLPSTTTPDDDDAGSSCKGRCGSPPSPGRCGCHDSCAGDESCCSDYYDLCQKEVTTSSTQETTSTPEATTQATESTTVSSDAPASEPTPRTWNTTTINKTVEAATRPVAPARATTPVAAKENPDPRLLAFKPRLRPQKTKATTTPKTTTRSTPRRDLNLHWQVDPSLSANRPRMHGTGEAPPQSMKSDGDRSTPTSGGIPAGTIEAVVVTGAVVVCVVVVAVFIRRRRRKRLEKESMVEDSDSICFGMSPMYQNFSSQSSLICIRPKSLAGGEGSKSAEEGVDERESLPGRGS